MINEKKEYITSVIEDIKDNKEALFHFISDLMDKYVIADKEAKHWKKEYMDEYKKFCDLQDEYNKAINESKQLRTILDSHTSNMAKIIRGYINKRTN